ncbi:unnamed protein product, partial [Iphiclides podalirius]
MVAAALMMARCLALLLLLLYLCAPRRAPARRLHLTRRRLKPESWTCCNRVEFSSTPFSQWKLTISVRGVAVYRYLN